MKLLTIAVLITSCFLLATSVRFKNKVTSLAHFEIMLRSSISIESPQNSNFKGHVSLDDKSRGIVISAGDGNENEELMKLVSEKLDEDSYLIDYRLFRSCDFDVKILNKKD